MSIYFFYFFFRFRLFRALAEKSDVFIENSGGEGGGGEELRVAAPSFSTRLLGVSGLHHDRVAYYCMGS